jgi:hypothetical protein
MHQQQIPIPQDPPRRQSFFERHLSTNTFMDTSQPDRAADQVSHDVRNVEPESPPPQRFSRMEAAIYSPSDVQNGPDFTPLPRQVHQRPAPLQQPFRVDFIPDQTFPPPRHPPPRQSFIDRHLSANTFLDLPAASTFLSITPLIEADNPRRLIHPADLGLFAEYREGQDHLFAHADLVFNPGIICIYNIYICNLIYMYTISILV